MIEEGDYEAGKRILLQLAKGNDGRADKELESAAERRNDYSALFDLAEAGYAPAQFEIGFTWLLHGDKDGLHYLIKAANQGLADAQDRLADYYLEGKVAPADQAEAKRLYMLAAAQGHHHAQFVLHDLSLKQKDYKEAYYWVRISTEGRSYPMRIHWTGDCQGEARRLGDILPKRDKAATEQKAAKFLETNNLLTNP